MVGSYTIRIPSNISFICKKYYAECIKKELGYAGDRVLRSGGSNSQTYEQIVDANPADIIENHVGELASFGLEVEDEMKYLPGMYGSPKLHKCPIVLRYIISSKRSSLKPLLKDLTSIFKLFQKQIKGFNDKRRLWSRVNGFWVIQNSQPLIDRIEKINKCNKARTLMTFDFTTLYTKIPHNLLIEALNEITDFCLGRGVQMLYM